MAVTDHESCSASSRVHAVEQLAALVCATSAEMLDVVVAMDRAEDHRVDGALDMTSWLVATLHVSRATAREWVRVGHALTELPRLRECFAVGALSWDQVAAATRFATPEVDELLAKELPGCTAAQIEEMARERRTRTRADAQRAHHESDFLWRKDHELDGYRYRGFLPAAEGAVLNAALERRAERAGADPETGVWAPFQHRCADALVDLARQDLSVDPGPDPALVVVHVDAEVLDGTTEGNGSVDGIQVPLDTVQRLLCDTPIEFSVDGPDGTCVGIGRTDRNPPRWLRRRIHRRDRDLCRFPGCGRRIRQIHHVRWWQRDEGPTDSWNLVGFCWAHHHLVHEGGWAVDGNADGELTFTSPHGRARSSRPPPLLPETKQRVHDITGLDLG
ncbi:MAG: DUF222 domain-containing protein [Microthrixaceae bacterium]